MNITMILIINKYNLILIEIDKFALTLCQI